MQWEEEGLFMLQYESFTKAAKGWFHRASQPASECFGGAFEHQLLYRTTHWGNIV